MTELETLATVAGAVPAAVLLTSFASKLGLPSAYARTFALVIGLVVVLAASILLGLTGVVQIFLAVLVGVEAGLAAWAAYDSATVGPTYDVWPADRESR
jgi:hypothetical protein